MSDLAQEATGMQWADEPYATHDVDEQTGTVNVYANAAVYTGVGCSAPHEEGGRKRYCACRQSYGSMARGVPDDEPEIQAVAERLTGLLAGQLREQFARGFFGATREASSRPGREND